MGGAGGVHRSLCPLSSDPYLTLALRDYFFEKRERRKDKTKKNVESKIMTVFFSKPVLASLYF